MMNCIIVDDEELARVIIEEYCNKIDHLNVVGSFEKALDADTAPHCPRR